MNIKGIGINIGNGSGSETGSFADGKIKGVGSFVGGIYKDLVIDGVCNITGDLEAETIKVNGVCNCSGNIYAKVFDCDGVLEIEGNLRAGTIDIDGVVTVNGKKIEADRISCDGVLNVEGEISADIIDAKGKLNAEEIVGDHIIIRSYWKSGIGGLFLKLGQKIGEKWNAKYSVIGLIEGTTVELRGVRAESVSGHDVYIGKNCHIDRVNASGELSVHPTAKVDEVINS